MDLPNKLNVFMDLGIDHIPTSCLCECGIGDVYTGSGKFSHESQIRNHQAKGKYRFFANTSHIRRYELLKHKR